MTRDDLLKTYVALKSAKSSGVISGEEYSQKVAALRYSDGGQEYALNPETGEFAQVGKDGKTQPKVAPSDALPDRFIPLLMMIVRKTIATFIRRLPITLIFGFAGMAFHTYLLVVANDGYNVDTPVSKFVAVKGNVVSSTVMWMVGSAIVMGLLGKVFSFGRKKKKIPLKAKVGAVAGYLAHKKLDALAVISAAIGLTLVMGSLVTGTANVSLAIGIGALFASRAGSVVALLARVGWNTAFSVFRKNTTQTHGMAVGYVALFATSVGFLLNSMMTPDGVQLGLWLLAGALGFSILQWLGVNVLNSLLVILFMGSFGAAMLGLPMMALADDGGWPEYMGDRPVTLANILIYLGKDGATEAVIRGVPIGLGAGVGAAMAQALAAMGIDIDIDPDWIADPDADGYVREDTRILDGDAARDWLIRNGYYDENGNPTQKYIDWQNAPHGTKLPGGLRGVATNPDGSIAIVTADGDAPAVDVPHDDTPEPAKDETTEEVTDQQEEDSEQDDDTTSGYQRPEWSLYNNPDPDNMAWDPDTASWRPKDDLHAEKMADQGYDFDADTDAWRKPPDGPDLDAVPDHTGIKYDTEWKPGTFTYDVTTEGLDKHLDELSGLEDDAKDAYRDLDKQIEEAVKNGDTWLADQLRDNQDDVRDHINQIQKQRTNIVTAVNNENQRVSDYNDKIREPGILGHAGQTAKDGYDIAAAILNDPSLLTKDPDFVEKVSAGMAAAERVRKGEGIEMQAGMFGYDAVKTGPSIADRFDEALGDVRSVNQLLEDAKNRGDSGAVEQLTKQLQEVKDHAAGVADELHQHTQDVKDWQVKSALANLSIGRKGTEIAAELMSVPSTAHAVTNVIDDFNRGQGLFNKSTFKDTGGDFDFDGTASGNRVHMTQADIDLDAEYHANVRVGTDLKDRVINLTNDPDATDADMREAINRALESRNSKLQLNNQGQGPNETFYDNVMEHRTNPLLEGTSAHINNQKMSDGRSRYYVVDANDGLERPVKLSDWEVASGPKAYSNGADKRVPGQDLDFYNSDNSRIIDRATGQPIKPAAVNGFVDDACGELGINRRAQEINYTHAMDPESYVLRPGQTPGQHISGSADFTSAEGRHAADVTDFKVNHARNNYDTGAEVLAEGGRATTKEQRRIIKNLLDAPQNRGSHMPEYFDNPTSIPKRGGGQKTVLEVLDDIGNDRTATGSGQAAIRDACGRDIPELNRDISRLQASITTLSPNRR